MADEVVSVGLAADNSSFIKAFNDAASAVKNVVGAGKSMVHAYNGITSQMTGMADRIESRFKKMALTIGAAGVGVGVAWHKGLANFKEFESAMANVSTVSDNSQVSFSRMSDSVMKMTSQMPQTAAELAGGLYEVESAGFHGADALTVLAATAKFSTAGLTDMVTSVRATASILNAYGLQAGDATHVTDVLFKAVEVGQMTAGEFAMNIGDWASSAASLQVPFETAAAALATMTTKGAIPANQAATSLSSIFRALINPSQVMAQTLKRQGYESGKAALQNLGLAGTLNMLWEASGKTESGFHQMIQESEGFKGALGLVTVGAGMLSGTVLEFNDHIKTAGTTQDAFNKQMDTLANKGKLFSNEVHRMGYEVGALVAPLASLVTGGATNFLHFMNSAPAPIRAFVAALQLIGPAALVFGGILAAMALKAFLWGKALTAITEARGLVGFFARAPLLKKAFLSVAEAGGPMNLLIIKMKQFVTGNATMRAAMLRTAGTVGLYAAGFAIAVVAITSLISAIGEADSKAKALRATFLQVGSGEISSMKQLQDEFDRTITAYNDAKKSSGGNSILNNALASLQMITPFTENTKFNAKKQMDELAGLSNEYADLAHAAGYFADKNGLSVDQVLSGLNQMSQDGTVSINTLMETYKRWLTLAEDPGIAKYQTDQYMMDSIAKATGQTAPKLDITKYVSPEIAVEWNRVNGVLKGTQDELAKVAEKAAKLDAIAQLGSSSAADLALALFTISDGAASASDKLGAFNEIIQQMLGNTVDLRDAQAAMLDSVEKAGQAFVDNGANLDLATEAGRKNQEVLSAAAKATELLAGETVKQTGNAADAIPIVASYAEGMIAVAQQAGWSTDQIVTMVNAMGLTPEVIQTLVTLPGIDPAIAQLLTTSGLLSGLNGYVAQAGVNITVGVSIGAVVPIAGGPHSQEAQRTGAGTGKTPTDIVNDFVKSVKANVPVTAGKKAGGGGGGGGGGKGGGGGGGGTPKWKPTADQLANMRDALSKPYIDMLTGDLGGLWQKQIAEKWFNTTALNTLSAGKTMLGANILKEAEKTGTDPKDELQKLADDYQKLVKLIGQVNADIVVNQTSNLQAFSDYVDGVEALIKHQQDVEDWKAGRSEISNTEYLAILQKRLSAETAYSDAWMSIQDKIKTVQDQIKSAQDDEIVRIKKYMEIQLALGEITQAQYLDYLRQRLAATAKYSDEWYALWQEINSLEKKVVDDTKAASDAVKSFAKDVRSAFDDIVRSVSDPMIQATSMIKAFGDQTTLTQDQVTGFYSHMLEGTQRWVAVIKQLKEKGVNKSFLNELIQAGPQSLTFAEQILAMGVGGISTINQNMADIAALSAGLGTDIANSSVGTLTQVDNSWSINVGDIAITGEMQGGVTIEAVTAAITAALGGLAVSVSNNQTYVAPTPTSAVATSSQPIVVGSQAYYDSQHRRA